MVVSQWDSMAASLAGCSSDTTLPWMSPLRARASTSTRQMGAVMRKERRKNSTLLLRSRCQEDTPSTKKQDSVQAESRVWAYMPQA